MRHTGTYTVSRDDLDEFKAGVTSEGRLEFYRDFATSFVFGEIGEDPYDAIRDLHHLLRLAEDAVASYRAKLAAKAGLPELRPITTELARVNGNG